MTVIRFDIYCPGLSKETSVDLPAVPQEGDHIRVVQRRSETGNHTSLVEVNDAELVIERVIWRSDNTADRGREQYVQPNPVLVCHFRGNKDR